MNYTVYGKMIQVNDGNIPLSFLELICFILEQQAIHLIRKFTKQPRDKIETKIDEHIDIGPKIEKRIVIHSNAFSETFIETESLLQIVR